MECASKILFFITIVTVTDCQKSQYLVLSESRKAGLEGTPLQVNCTAHVTSPLDSLKWIPGHDGQSDVQQVYLTNTTVVMTISSLHGSDAGRYKCLLVMADGREETAEFELMVRRKESNAAACSITQFKCKKTKHCIFLRYRCDGKDDCGDDSDEDCESNPCLNKFRCNNSRCVDNQDVCNHVDNCGDLSDEAPSCGKPLSTTQSTLEDSQFGWLKITMSTVIACTVGIVILISFIVIVVFRVKMKRLRQRRTARVLGSMYRHGESREATSCGQGEEALNDQRPFLPTGSHHYGNIIVNVNNGVQYLPGYDYSLFVAVPPPYTECGAGVADGRDPKSQPPPYSTIDRNNIQQQTCVAGQGNSIQQQTCETGQGDSNIARPSLSVSSVQSCLGSMRDQEHVRLGNHIKTNGTQLCQGQHLTGITSSFLQSLLGSHCEGGPTIVNCQPLDIQTVREATNGGTSLKDMSFVTCRARSTPSSDMQPSSLTSNDVASGTWCSERDQDTHVTEVNWDNHSSVANTSLPALVAGLQNVITKHHNTDPQKTCRDATQTVSDGSNQIPLGGTGFNQKGNTHPAPVSVSPSGTSPNKPDIEELDDTQLFAAHQGDSEICLVLEHEDRSELGHHSEILHPCHTGVTVCHAVANERPCHSENNQTRSQLVIDGSVSRPVVSDTHSFFNLSNTHSPVSQDNTHSPVSQDNIHSTVSQGNADIFIIDGSSLQSSIAEQSDPPNKVVVPEPADPCPDGTANRFSGELNIRDGCLVLESPRHTASSQILSHLQGVYAAEEQASCSTASEPVLNTRRPVGVVTRPPLPKFQSDFVLRFRNQPL